jgi:signal transduction histidine kinase
VHAAAIVDAEGRVLASTVPGSGLPKPEEVFASFTSPPLPEANLHWHKQEIRASDQGQSDLFSQAHSRDMPPLGQLFLQVSNKSLDAEMRRALVKAVMAALLVLFFGVLLALAMSRGLIRMLGDIGRVVAGIGEGRTDLRVEHTGADELGYLADGINKMANVVAQTQEEMATRIAKATATLRRERDNAEAATRARTRFFTAASHDLRQPLHALSLFVGRLERDVSHSPLLPRVRSIAQTVQNLQTLLDTLLDYSRIDGKVFQANPRPVCAAEVIGHVTHDFAEAANAKQLILRTRTGNCWLMTDPGLLHRILLNLISNAVRYTEHGGILVACRCGPTHARIEVWDTGPGIPEVAHETVFEELVQLGNPERDPAKGLGLGLAIVRRLAELLDHPVHLYSRVGHGSRFSITIPVVPAPSGAEVDEVKTEDPLTGPRILLVSESSEAQSELVEQLVGWGLEVSHCTTPAAAADWIISHGPPAVLIWDLPTDAPGSAQSEAALDWLTTATGKQPPALIISNGPVPALNELPGNAPRLLLPRPFRPARLRALLTHLLSPGD